MRAAFALLTALLGANRALAQTSSAAAYAATESPIAQAGILSAFVSLYPPSVS
jgi:hypothetical protein